MKFEGGMTDSAFGAMHNCLLHVRGSLSFCLKSRGWFPNTVPSLLA